MNTENVLGEEAWVDSNQEPASEITVAKLQDLCQRFKVYKDEKKALEDKASEMSAEIQKLETKILEYLKENGMDSFRGDFGLISLKINRSVRQPETHEDKIALFNYLRDKNVFEEMVTVNSRTLSSWAISEIEAKEREGCYGWAPPGLKQPSEHMSLSLRKK